MSILYKKEVRALEIWDLFDGHRKPLGKLHERGNEIEPGEYHVVVEIATINLDGRILLTQRDPVKTYPLLWEMTGGSVNAGETSVQGAVRELQEETGLVTKEEELYFIGEIKKGNSFYDFYVFQSLELIELSNLKLQPSEVCDALFVTKRELEDMNAMGRIVSPVWERYNLYKEAIECFTKQ